jgi:hypothetical protein
MMKQLHVLERDAAQNQGTRASKTEKGSLNVTVVYHDAHTHSWAQEVYDRMIKTVGKGSVRATWWKISDLMEPGVLAGAVYTAMRAEVIVVAIDAAEGLPFPFHVWVDTWLPHRSHGVGCLFALIGNSGSGNQASERVRGYLHEVARMGGFEFLFEERPLRAHTPASPRLQSKLLDHHVPAPEAQALAVAPRS